MADVQERLKKLGASSRIGGKGTPRRKMKRAPQRSGTDDKKLQLALKKLNVQPIQAIEEVNMFKSDGNVIHFAAPKGTLAPTSNPSTDQPLVTQPQRGGHMRMTRRTTSLR